MRIKRNYMYMRNDPEIHVFSYPAEYAYYYMLTLFCEHGITMKCKTGQ